MVHQPTPITWIDRSNFCLMNDIINVGKYIVSSPEPKVQWWAYSIVPHTSTFSNIFPSETSGPVEAKSYVEPPWDGGTKSLFKWSLVTWPRWPPCPYMVKIFSGTKKADDIENLVCSIGCMSTTKFIQMMTLDWPWPILWQGQIWSVMLSYGKKVKQWIFQKLL